MEHLTYYVQILPANSGLNSVYEARCNCGWSGEQFQTPKEAAAQAVLHGPPMVSADRRESKK